MKPKPEIATHRELRQSLCDAARGNFAPPVAKSITVRDRSNIGNEAFPAHDRERTLIDYAAREPKAAFVIWTYVGRYDLVSLLCGMVEQLNRAVARHVDRRRPNQITL